jgi:ribosomal protein S21
MAGSLSLCRAGVIAPVGQFRGIRQTNCVDRVCMRPQAMILPRHFNASARVAMSTPVNAEVELMEGDDLERGIQRFIREVKSSGVLFEVRRKRFHEDNQEKRKRRLMQRLKRDARDRRVARKRNDDFYGSTMPLIGEEPKVFMPKFRREDRGNLPSFDTNYNEPLTEATAGLLDVQYLDELNKNL